MDRWRCTVGSLNAAGRGAVERDVLPVWIREARGAEDRAMIDNKMFRQTFLERAGLVALSSGFLVPSRDTRAQIAVPNSAGTGSPKLKAPANACDCHMHIYDPARFPMVPSQRMPPTDAAVPQYRLLQKRIGTTRVVIVTPRNYATQNWVTVDALAQLGPNARGVAVLILVENPVTLYGFA